MARIAYAPMRSFARSSKSSSLAALARRDAQGIPVDGAATGGANGAAPEPDDTDTEADGQTKAGLFRAGFSKGLAHAA